MLAFAALAFFSRSTGCMRVFSLVEPATLVFGRLAESGVAVRAVAWMVIFLAGMRFKNTGVERTTDRPAGWIGG